VLAIDKIPYTVLEKTAMSVVVNVESQALRDCIPGSIENWVELMPGRVVDRKVMFEGSRKSIVYE